jgi:hypothetical protein
MNGAATVRERLYLARYPSSTFATAQKMPKRSRDREGVEMARRVTYGDESHEWSDVDGEYLANSGVTFA